MTNVLTPRRRAILKAMRNGRALSTIQVMMAAGAASTDTAQNNLVVLKRHGYVTWEPECQRTLRLTGKGLWASQGYELLWTADTDGIHKEE